ncbi:6-phosphogluconate dehydrogenase [Paractinoplanes deccanensis]|uniref:6-phosphogluconate dehydrogenase n=1 Tax=Paractinoplanes deccanensis TaxID=113561 RepID=A0ABQ3Y726_9ACTN|nr:NAD(P)-binding domain-containing protein [Actinoplanes deccanensis]GID75801.1 6-phosphogluconate dehydrogenase [Actinoplanes deccanensis]
MSEVTTPTARIAVIGTGAIGTAVARRLLEEGHAPTVWNRTRDRTAGLAAAGARPAGSVREAVSSSSLILVTLTDYAAVRECLTLPDMDLSGRTVVGLYTGTPAEARSIASRVTASGGRYLDAGVQTSPDMIGTDTATILYSGSREAFEEHRSLLGLLSRPRFVGEAPEAAALWDLALFGIWYDAHLGLLRALDTVRAAGIDVDDFADTAGTQIGHVIAGVPGTVAEMKEGSYPPGPADLTEHLTVVRHLIDLRKGHSLGDGGLPDVAARIEALIAEGRGGEGLTATVGPAGRASDAPIRVAPRAARRDGET